MMKTFISVCILFFASMVHADTTYKIVVPYPPGGTTDHAARYASKVLSEAGINTIVQYRPGAQGTLGTKSVIDQGDPYTLVTVAPGSGIISPMLLGTNYDVVQDLEPVAGLIVMNNVVIVPSKSPIKDIKDLSVALKNKNKPLTFGYGAASHGLDGFRLVDAIGGTVVEVPYNGTSPLAVAVASGEVDFAVMDYSPLLKELVDSGRVRLIAAHMKQRIPALPELKTLAEQGINGVESMAWLVIMGKKGMDPKVVSQINKAINDAMSKDQANILFNFMNPMIATPAQVREIIVNTQSTAARLTDRLKTKK